MLEFEHRIRIDALPERVWAVLIDVARWPEWTESVTRAERLDSGPFGPGSEARLWLKGAPTLAWRVTRFDDGHFFAWESRSRGVHSVGEHEVAPADGGGTDLTLRVRQNGFAATLLRPMLSPVSRRNLKMEAEGLKRRAES